MKQAGPVPIGADLFFPPREFSAGTQQRARQTFPAFSPTSRRYFFFQILKLFFLTGPANRNSPCFTSAIMA